MNAAIRSKNTLYLTSRVVLACAISCVFGGLAGCGSSSGGSSGTGSGSAAAGGTPLVSGGAKDIYVIQFDSSNESYSILDFAADTNGTLSPKGALLPPTGFAYDSMATDSAGQLYLGGQNVEGGGNPLNQVLVYAAGATGAATPLRTITLPNDENSQYLPLDMTVDSTGKLYVVGLGLVGTFPANASGDTSPITSFSVTLPYGNVSANGPTGIAVDTAGNIYLGMYLEAAVSRLKCNVFEVVVPVCHEVEVGQEDFCWALPTE